MGKIANEFAKVVGIAGLLTLSVGGYMAIKVGTQKANGCELVNTAALNPLAEFAAIGENAQRLTDGKKCSWGFAPV